MRSPFSAGEGNKDVAKIATSFQTEDKLGITQMLEEKLLQNNYFLMKSSDMEKAGKMPTTSAFGEFFPLP